MPLQKVCSLLTAIAWIVAMGVAPVAPADAAPSSPATICSVAGSVFVDAVTSVPPAAPGASTYSFNNVAVVCVGTGIFGVSTNTTSNGSTGTGCGPPFHVDGTFGQLCGTYNANFAAGSCNGSIGGPGLWNSSATVHSWSLTSGAVITGHIDCGLDTTGVVALVAVPTSPNTVSLPGNPGGGPVIPIDPVPLLSLGRSCPRPSAASYPLVGTTPPPVAWACSIFVSGVAVIVDWFV